MIRKLGTIDCNLVETTPIVFSGKLYRFEYIRREYRDNHIGNSYFRFTDIETCEHTPAFAVGYHLGSAHVEENTVYAYGVDRWGGSIIKVFWSYDLEKWESDTALNLPGWEIFNNSVCKGQEGYTMDFEIGAPPEETGVRFTMRFAKSDDLVHWKLTQPECVFFQRPLHSLSCNPIC